MGLTRTRSGLLIPAGVAPRKLALSVDCFEGTDPDPTRVIFFGPTEDDCRRKLARWRRLNAGSDFSGRVVEHPIQTYRRPTPKRR
jgi:hypothetical protein